MLLLLMSASFVDAAEIVLRERALRSGNMIRLGDVADISAATPATMHNLATTPLLAAPAPGTSQFLNRSLLRELLASRGIDLRQLTILGAQVVEIGDAPKRVAKPEVSEPIELPTQEVIPALPLAVVAIRNIERGDLVRASDVELREQERRVSISAIRTLDEVIGKEARTSLREGRVILKTQVRAPLQVLRGETVTVFAKTGGISVKTYATARQDGALGDLIQVETLDEKERYTAHVSGRRELEVFATGKKASELATLERRGARRR